MRASNGARILSRLTLAAIPVLFSAGNAVASNNVRVQCNSSWSEWYTLCDSGGNDCKNLTFDPSVNPAPASASPQDNVSFDTDPANVVWEVRNVAATSVKDTGHGAKTTYSDNPVSYTVQGLGTSSLTVSNSPVTRLQTATGASPVQISVFHDPNNSNNTDFALLQYHVKCTAPASTPALKLQKAVQNNSSVSLAASSFTLSAGGSSYTLAVDPVAAGQTVSSPVTSITTLSANTSYTVSEDISANKRPPAPTGTVWKDPAVSCAATPAVIGTTASGSSFTFGATGSPVVTCTVTNVLDNAAPQKGTINLKKVTTGPNGVIAGSNTFHLKLGGTAYDVPVPGFGSATVPVSLDAGSYDFSEPNLPGAPAGLPAGSKWENTGLSCQAISGDGTSVSNGTSVTLGAGGEVTCTATNTLVVPVQKGSITIKKHVSGGTSSEVFGFSSTFGAFGLTSGGASYVKNSLDQGAYTITEDANSAFFDPAVTCQTSGGATYSSAPRGVTIVIPQSYAETPSAVCTFDNKKAKDDRAEDVTKLFIHRRVDNLLSNQPDRARILRRLDGAPAASMKDGGSYSEPFDNASPVPGGLKDPVRSDLSRLQGRTSDAGSSSIGTVKVSASLSQAAAEARVKREEEACRCGPQLRRHSIRLRRSSSSAAVRRVDGGSCFPIHRKPGRH